MDGWMDGYEYGVGFTSSEKVGTKRKKKEKDGRREEKQVSK